MKKTRQKITYNDIDNVLNVKGVFYIIYNSYIGIHGLSIHSFHVSNDCVFVNIDFHDNDVTVRTVDMGHILQVFLKGQIRQI